MRALMVAACCVAFGTAQAAASADGDALDKAGLTGVWAQDCTQAPSESNWYDGYSVSNDGRVTETLSREPGTYYRTNTLRGIHILAPGRIGYSTNQKNESTQEDQVLDVVVRMEDKRINTWSSTIRGGAKPLIQDGKFVEGGAPTMKFNKCD